MAMQTPVSVCYVSETREYDTPVSALDAVHAVMSIVFSCAGSWAEVCPRSRSR